MTTPDLNGYLTQLRTDGYSLKLYMSAFTGASVVSGAISADPDYPITALAYTTSTGSSANVKRGQRVVITTAGGAYVGETSVRYSGTISSTSMPIREMGQGELDIASGMILTVYDTFVLSDKLPTADATFSPDGVAYVAQNGTVSPLVGSGGYWAGPLDTGQAYATVAFDGTSYTVDSGSGATVTHSWSAPTATGSTSSILTSPSFTFPAGEHLVTHIGTDSSNSATWTQYVKVFVDTDPLEIELTDFGTDRTVGPTATVRIVSGDASLSALPDGATIILWSPSYTVPRAAVASRSHIFMTGILRRDRMTLDPEENELTFEIISPLARLAELAGFSKVMLRDSTPTAWRDVESLTVRRAVLLLLRYYTNVNDIGFDIEWDVVDQPWNRFYLQANTPYAMTLELVSGIAARFVIDRTGRLMIQAEFQYLTLGDRNAEVDILTVGADDALTVETAREHWESVQTVEVQGFIASATTPTPYIARWPETPGRGTAKPVQQRMIGASGAEIRRWAGFYGAEVNRTFTNAQGEKYRAPEVTIRLRGIYDVFDWYRGYIVLDLDETTNPREVDLTAMRFLFNGASVTVDSETGSHETEVRLKAETAAPQGVRYTPPVSTPITPPSDLTDFNFDFDTLPDFINQPQITFTGVGLGISRLLVSGNGGADIALASDSNGLPLVPTFTSIATGLTGTVYWMQVDPWEFNRFFCVTSTGVWVCQDIFSASGWIQVLDNSRLDSGAHYYQHITMSPYIQGWILVSAGRNHGDVSFDYGNTWTTVNLSGGIFARTSTAGANDLRCTCEPSWHNNGTGVVYCGLYVTATNTTFTQSEDWGLTWPNAFNIPDTPGVGEAMRVYPPFLNSSSGNNAPGGSQNLIVTSASWSGARPGGNLYTSVDGGTTLTRRVNAAADTWGAKDASTNRPVSGFEDNGQSYTMLQRLATGATLRVAYTDDFFTTITDCTNQPTFTPLSGSNMCNINTFPRGNDGWAVVYGYDTGGGILQWTGDRGDTPWVDIVGNLNALWGDTKVSFASAV